MWAICLKYFSFGLFLCMKSVLDNCCLSWTKVKVSAHWVQNFPMLKNKYDLTLWQSRLHTASETFVCHKKFGSASIVCVFASVAFILIWKDEEYGKTEKRMRKFRTPCAMALRHNSLPQFSFCVYKLSGCSSVFCTLRKPSYIVNRAEFTQCLDNKATSHLIDRDKKRRADEVIFLKSEDASWCIVQVDLRLKKWVILCNSLYCWKKTWFKNKRQCGNKEGWLNPSVSHSMPFPPIVLGT